MKRRKALFNAAGIAGASALSASAVYAQGMGPARFGETIIPPEKEQDREKHVPFIDVPASVKAGEPFMVTVEVGRIVHHPNTVEHHIRWIHLYALAEGSKAVVNVGTFEFAPAYVEPKVTIPVMLDKSSTMYALGYCNIHGVWDNSTQVTVLE